MEMTNSIFTSGEVVETMDALNFLENRQCVISEKTQQIADLVNQLNAGQTNSLKDLIGQVERDRKASENQSAFHVDRIMKLQKTVADLSERRDIDMKKVNALQDENEKLKKAVEAQTAITDFARTQLSTLREKILEKQTESEQIQDETFYSDSNESSFSAHDNSSKSGTTIYYNNRYSW